MENKYLITPSLNKWIRSRDLSIYPVTFFKIIRGTLDLPGTFFLTGDPSQIFTVLDIANKILIINKVYSKQRDLNKLFYW